MNNQFMNDSIKKMDEKTLAKVQTKSFEPISPAQNRNKGNTLDFKITNNFKNLKQANYEFGKKAPINFDLRMDVNS